MFAARSLQTPSTAPEHDRQRSGPRLVDESQLAHASPARELQNSLSSGLEQALEPNTPLWSGALRLAIIFGGSAGLWAAIIAGVRAVF